MITGQFIVLECQWSWGVTVHELSLTVQLTSSPPNICICSSSQNETRFSVELNNFGFFPNGTLDVNLLSLRLPDQVVNYSAHPVSACFVLVLRSVICESCCHL